MSLKGGADGLFPVGEIRRLIWETNKRFRKLLCSKDMYLCVDHVYKAASGNGFSTPSQPAPRSADTSRSQCKSTQLLNGTLFDIPRGPSLDLRRKGVCVPEPGDKT